jgi:hypothetical protein
LAKENKTRESFKIAVDLDILLKSLKTTAIYHSRRASECFMDLGKLNFLMVVWFGSSQFSLLPQLPQKGYIQSISGYIPLKNNHLA